MFRGRITPHSWFVLQYRGLIGTGISIGISSIPNGCVAGPVCHSMFKTPERKESSSRKGGTYWLTTDTLCWTQKGVKWSARKVHFG